MAKEANKEPGPVELKLDPLGVPPGFMPIDNGPNSQPVIPGDPTPPVPAEPAETTTIVEEDPLNRELVRDNDVDHQVQRVLTMLDKQVREHVSTAEYEKVLAGVVDAIEELDKDKGRETLVKPGEPVDLVQTEGRGWHPAAEPELSGKS